MRLRQRDQHGDDCIPPLDLPGDDHVAADLAVQSAFERRGDRRVDILVFCRRCQYGRIEHGNLGRQSRDRERGVHSREPVGRGRGVGIGEHLEPLAESRGIEPLLRSRAGRAPQIEIEHRGQLIPGGQRQQLTAGRESTVPNHAMKEFGRQVRDRAGEVRGLGQPGGKVARRSGAVGLRHRFAMIPTASARKQSWQAPKGATYYR